MSHPARLEVLLVEDSLSDAKLLKRWLLGSEWIDELHIVSDGEQALDFLRQGRSVQPPGLVILDVNLPKLSGLDVLAELKKDPPLAAIPVIVLTGFMAQGDAERARQLRASLCLTKPSDADEFNNLVREIEQFLRDHVSSDSSPE